MEKFYTDERNAQIVVALLKQHKIKKVIASPGTTNIAFVRSVQIDPFFEVYSSVDERSAAYIACGLAAESGEPVVISCTGATASRNYMPGLTEAFYRKLPVLAITSTRDVAKYGHHEDQVIDRTILPKDVAKLSVTLPTIKNDNDVWECEIKTNKAILELKRHGGGPVHINLTTIYTRSYSTQELPNVRLIERILTNDISPILPKKKIGIFVGSHGIFTEQETSSIEQFCETNNAVVFCDHTSNYYGKYRVQFLLVASQVELDKTNLIPEVLIHIGEISGFHTVFRDVNEVWRVSDDGELRDPLMKLRFVFEMPIKAFFDKYIDPNKKNKENLYFKNWQHQINETNSKIPELPFSNVWIAQRISKHIPEESVIHFGILNSLRSWNFCELPEKVYSNSNVGGFGIDGGLSALIGASFAKKSKIYFGIIGDLAFFYDMNVIGNRHICNNIRIMLINNGQGVEFGVNGNPAIQFGNERNSFISAAGHFGNKSKSLVKDYVQNLGFEYLSAENKEEFEKVYNRFLTKDLTPKPLLFEIFINSEDEYTALEQIYRIETNIKGKAKQVAKQLLGEKGIKSIKKIFK